MADIIDLKLIYQIVLCPLERNGAPVVCQGGGRMETYSWKCSDVLEKHLGKPQECQD